MKVLIIPEDPTYSGYILRPLVERLLESVGKPHAQVIVLTNPRAQGLSMIRAEMPNIFQRYKHMDLLLFLPDDDCENREEFVRQVEAEAELEGVKLIGCASIPEVEVWLLAGHVDKLPASWAIVRADCDLKERYFAPFIAEYGDNSVGGGRQRLMREALATGLSGHLARCPELAQLQTRLRTALT